MHLHTNWDKQEENMKKRLYLCIVIGLLFILQSAFSEMKSFSNDELGYDVLAEVNYVGINLSEEEIEEYDSIVFNWCNEIGHDARRIQKLSKEMEWGLNQSLSEYELKEGEVYGVRIVPISKQHSDTSSFVIVLLSISNNENFKIIDMIEAYIEIETMEKTDASERDGRTLYENKSLNYKGSADAQCMGKLTEEDFNALVEKVYTFANRDGYVATQVNKLTKEQDWLLQQSLSKYELKKGETYSVSICPEPKSYPASFSAVLVVLTITDINKRTGGYQYQYYAYDVTIVK